MTTAEWQAITAAGDHAIPHPVIVSKSHPAPRELASEWGMET